MSEPKPEADRIDQNTAALEPDPQAPPELGDRPVDEADLLDQTRPVADDETDDYPPDQR